MQALDSIRELIQRMQTSIIGQQAVIERLVMGMLANGNVLLEGLPGLAKTRAVKSLAQNLDAEFSRIQFTPDLLPSDITGTEVMHQSGGETTFRFDPGPIFANIVLADEINRAPAKVQSALLEAMEERQVTVAGTTHPMPKLFMVMATQNPVEQEGTYPLPEAQMDRFLVHVYIDYGTEEAEGDIIRLVRHEEQKSANTYGQLARKEALEETHCPIDQQAVFQAREEISVIHVGEVVERYMVDLVFASRYPQRYDEDLARWLHVGASPRGGIALDKCARVQAWLDGREDVLPDDVQAVVHDVFRHRLMLSFEASADGVTADDIIDKLVQQVAVA